MNATATPTAPKGFVTFTAAAERNGLEHGGRIALEDGVLASAMVWLGDTVLAYVGYADGTEALARRDIREDKTHPLTLVQASRLMRAHVGR